MCSAATPKWSQRAQTKTIEYMVCKPVMSQKTVQYTVCVPYTEARQATRNVCHMVPTPMTSTVCEDQGHWEEQPVAPCGCAAPCNSGCGCSDCGSRAVAAAARPRRLLALTKVWVPKIVQKQVQCTVMKPVMSTESYQYNVTLYKQESEKSVSVCNYVEEKQSSQVQCTVCVPQTKTYMRPVTTCHCVPEQKTETYNVCVPYTVQKQIQCTVCVPQTKTGTCQKTICKQVAATGTETYCVCVPHTVEHEVTVQVCRMVPKTITCQVPVNTGCASGCASGCGCN